MENNRHAYLILAHNNWASLERLIKFFDHPFNDIYVHVDKKATDFDIDSFKSICKTSKIYFVNRHKVFWGSDNVAVAELELFKAALLNGPYKYYHLLSGNDLPLKPLKEINSFFNSTDKNFIIADEESEWEHRLQIYMNVFDRTFLPKKIKTVLNRYSNSLQIKVGINRLKKLKKDFPKVTKGHQWGDFTDEAVKEIVKNEKKIRKFCRFTNCCDEMYKQIILSNSSLADSISGDDLRAIDWSECNPHPKTYTFYDYEHLKDVSGKGKIFARKFDESVDLRIINKIYEDIS